MKKRYQATKEALEIAKIVLQSCEIKGAPNAEDANAIADFIKTLSERLEPICEPLQELRWLALI